MPRRIPPYLRRARKAWTDLTAFAVFIAWVLGLSLVADALTPLSFRNPALAHMTRTVELEWALLLWFFVGIAFWRPLFGGMASGLLLSLLFGISSIVQDNWFGVVFWGVLGVLVVVGTYRGIRDGTLSEGKDSHP